jgi:hypothetical protein
LRAIGARKLVVGTQCSLYGRPAALRDALCFRYGDVRHVTSPAAALREIDAASAEITEIVDLYRADDIVQRDPAARHAEASAFEAHRAALRRLRRRIVAATRGSAATRAAARREALAADAEAFEAERVVRRVSGRTRHSSG